MAKKDKGGFLKTGMKFDDIGGSLSAGGGGDFDEEIVILGDGDEMFCVFAAPPETWVIFSEHYIAPSFRVCTGSGCQYCEDGNRASRRVMVGVYVTKRYKPARNDYPARKFENEGFRYFKMNNETFGTLSRIAKRRNNVYDDRIFAVTRSGSGMDTKYDIERMDEKPTAKMLKWPGDMNIEDKLMVMATTEPRVAKDKENTDDYDIDKVADEARLPRKSKRSKRRR